MWKYFIGSAMIGIVVAVIVIGVTAMVIGNGCGDPGGEICLNTVDGPSVPLIVILVVLAWGGRRLIAAGAKK